jgi:hypothetical protein
MKSDYMVEGRPGKVDTCYQLFRKVFKSFRIRYHVDQQIVRYLLELLPPNFRTQSKDPEGEGNRPLQNMDTYLKMDTASYKHLNLHDHHCEKLKSCTEVPGFTKTKDMTTWTKVQQGITS